LTKANEAKAAKPTDPAAGLKFLEMGWKNAGYEPDEPMRTYDDMMKVIDFFDLALLKKDGGFWINTKEYCIPTEPLGGRIYGTDGKCTVLQYVGKM
jgi:hypothetical protein